MSDTPTISADAALKAFALMESALLLAGRDREFDAKINYDLAREQIFSAFPERYRESACVHTDMLIVNLVQSLAPDSKVGTYG